jgi:hypothetical protein
MIALSVFYSFLAAMLVAPLVIVVWERFFPLELPGLGGTDAEARRSADD